MYGGLVFHNPDQALVLLQCQFLLDEMRLDWILLLN